MERRRDGFKDRPISGPLNEIKIKLKKKKINHPLSDLEPEGEQREREGKGEKKMELSH